MHIQHIVVIGASAGGLTVLKKLVSLLPDDFPSAVFIVLHIQPKAVSLLPEILARCSKLPVLHPINNQTIQPGHIYIAPPDWHMTVVDGTIHLRRGPKINYSRPSINALFCSAANSYGTAVIGVLLTGMLNDGSDGLLAIHKNKGITVVQDPTEAEYPDMPTNALEQVPIDYCLSIAAIVPLLCELVNTNRELR